jgi:hypothetical protein
MGWACNSDGGMRTEYWWGNILESSNLKNDKDSCR